jgi:hypothetical protein
LGHVGTGTKLGDRLERRTAFPEDMRHFLLSA